MMLKSGSKESTIWQWAGRASLLGTQSLLQEVIIPKTTPHRINAVTGEKVTPVSMHIIRHNAMQPNKRNRLKFL